MGDSRNKKGKEVTAESAVVKSTVGERLTQAESNALLANKTSIEKQYEKNLVELLKMNQGAQEACKLQMKTQAEKQGLGVKSDAPSVPNTATMSKDVADNVFENQTAPLYRAIQMLKDQEQVLNKAIKEVKTPTKRMGG